MASLAYLELLNQGVISDLSNNNITTFIKNDDFNDLLIFNSNINNNKSIFEENINTINTINSNKSNKIEIKDLIKPNNYKEAINSPYKDNWIKSMQLELVL
jgi:hypothetical protein